jgi:hypothetical protein
MPRKRTNRRSRKTRRNRRNIKRGGALNRSRFAFKVELLGEGNQVPQAANHSAEIIAWYIQNVPNDIAIDIYGMSDIQLEYSNNRRLFLGSFIPTEAYDPEISIDMYVDPYDDGNHPININGHEYLVKGTKQPVP